MAATLCLLFMLAVWGLFGSTAIACVAVFIMGCGSFWEIQQTLKKRLDDRHKSYLRKGVDNADTLH